VHSEAARRRPLPPECDRHPGNPKKGCCPCALRPPQTKHEHEILRSVVTKGNWSRGTGGYWQGRGARRP
jgi:hypothetical protein